MSGVTSASGAGSGLSIGRTGPSSVGSIKLLLFDSSVGREAGGELRIGGSPVASGLLAGGVSAAWGSSAGDWVPTGWVLTGAFGFQPSFPPLKFDFDRTNRGGSPSVSIYCSCFFLHWLMKSRRGIGVRSLISSSNVKKTSPGVSGHSTSSQLSPNAQWKGFFSSLKFAVSTITRSSSLLSSLPPWTCQNSIDLACVRPEISSTPGVTTRTDHHTFARGDSLETG